MQSRMTATRDKVQSPSPAGLAPIGKAVMESLEEGIVVFDSYGRLLYANQNALRLVDGLDELAATRPDVLRRRLAAVGGRTKRLQAGVAELGEAVLLPGPQHHNGGTLVERERAAIVEMLEATGGRLAEAARRLGISRTTLWRRLRSYGLDRFREIR
jgi:transcriptional regulator of acetoin/glycerol metabolism